MRKLLIIAVILVAAFLMAFTILDNTSVSEGIALTTLSPDATTLSSAISLKGYENVHILAPYSYPFTESSTIELTLYKSATAAGTFTEYASTTAVASVTASGVLELEAVRDMNYPYIKAELTNDSDANVDAVSLGLKPQAITADATAQSAAISYDGYNGGYIGVPYTFAAAAADAEMVVTLSKATGSTADYTDVSSTTVLGTPTDSGITHFEIDYDATYKYYKVLLAPAGQNCTTSVSAVKNGPEPEVGVTVVFYGSTQKPF